MYLFVDGKPMTRHSFPPVPSAWMPGEAAAQGAADVAASAAVSKNEKKKAPGGKRERGTPRAKLKLWLRQLPPGLAEEELRAVIEDAAPAAAASVDWLRVVPASKQVPTATAYMHFKSEDALQTAHAKLDGHRLADAQGREFTVISEYAPFQRIPRKKVIDKREGTIENDPEFLAFLEEFAQQRSCKVESAEAWLERREKDETERAAGGGDEKNPAVLSTPLLDFVRDKMERNARDKMKRKALEDERRKKMQEEMRKQQQRGALAARGGRGGSSGAATGPGGPAARGGRGGGATAAQQVPQALASRPASAGSRPASAGGSTGRSQPDPAQQQQAKGAARGGKQSGGKGRAVPPQQAQAPQQVQATAARPASAGQQAPAAAKPAATDKTQAPKGGAGGSGSGSARPAARGGRGGGGGVKEGGGGVKEGGGGGGGQERGGAAGSAAARAGGAAGGGAGGGVAEGGGATRARGGKTARPQGVYRPKGRGGET